MNKYRITLLYDRASIGEVVLEVEYPKTPTPKLWEEEVIEDEAYWKIDTLQGIVLARKTFLYAMKVERVSSSEVEE